MGEKEKILIADDHEIARSSLKDLLDAYGHTVIGEAANTDEVRKLVEDKIDFRVAIIDGEMPNVGDGEKAASYIREKRPDAVIFSLSATQQNFGDYNILKGEVEELVDAIKAI